MDTVAPGAWQLRTHPDYHGIVSRYEYTMDAFTGSARDKAVEAAGAVMAPADLEIDLGTQHVGTYLYRRVQGEHLDNYRERLRVSRYPLHFQAIVGSFVGAISSIEAEADREFGVLGSPTDQGSFFREWQLNADGKYTSYFTLINQIVRALVVWHDVWYAVFPPEDESGMPQLVLFEPPMIRNWTEQSGLLTEVLIHERHDSGVSLTAPTRTPRDRYLFWNRHGFTRYEAEGVTVTTLEDLSNPEMDSPIMSVDGKPRLPINRVRLPMAFHVGYRLAQGNISLYNLLSDARNIVRVANHPLLRGMVDRGAFDATLEERRRGSNVLMGQWDFIAPPTANANLAYQMYIQEVQDFYITSYQMYNDAPRQMTATQVSVDDARGRTAFLSILSDAMDAVENDILFLLSQYMAPRDPDSWTDAHVKRSKAFRAPNPMAEEQGRVALMLQLASRMPLPLAAEWAGFSQERIEQIQNVPDMTMMGAESAALSHRQQEESFNMQREQWDMQKKQQAQQMQQTPEEDEETVQPNGRPRSGQTR